LTSNTSEAVKQLSEEKKDFIRPLTDKGVGGAKTSKAELLSLLCAFHYFAPLREMLLFLQGKFDSFWGITLTTGLTL
jgi:hypothetical protein